MARNLNGWDDSDAGVPAKMRTRDNVHLTILRQRILIRRQNSPVKCSRENVHQPRICAPNSLHFAHALHFAHGAVLKTVISPPCSSQLLLGCRLVFVCTKLVPLCYRLLRHVLPSIFALRKLITCTRSC